jgi:hypothetical protein
MSSPVCLLPLLMISTYVYLTCALDPHYELPRCSQPCTEVRCGNQNGLYCTEDEYCASPDELHEVSCCSDTDLGGWRSCSVGQVGRTVYGERDAGSLACTSDATLAEALAVCTAVGARLCTVSELEANCGQGTGCSHDRKPAFFFIHAADKPLLANHRNYFCVPQSISSGQQAMEALTTALQTLVRTEASARMGSAPSRASAVRTTTAPPAAHTATRSAS